MSSFAEISIRIGTDLAQLSTDLQNAQRKLDKIGRKFEQVGKQLSAGLTAPIAALGFVSVKNFDAQAKAIAQMEAALESTGGVANKTSKELQDLASSQQNNSLFGDEKILKDATAQLLTFTNIADEQFDRTQQAALDLATRLDGDLKGASIQLGKALNDPVKGLSALGKSGIQFTEAQKQVINSLAKGGQLAKAQTIILDELETQYGGAAAAAAAAGTGPLQQLSNILGDILEEFGALIIAAINPFVAKLKEMALRFQKLSPEVKKVILVIAGIAAAIGPVVLAIGALLPLLPAIAAGFAALMGPIGLAVAAIAAVGVVIVKHWKPIKKILIDVANYFIDLYNESILVRASVQGIVLVFKNIYVSGKFLFNFLSDALLGLGDLFYRIFSNAGQAFKALITGNFRDLPGIAKNAFNEINESFADQAKLLGADFKTLAKDIQNNGIEAINAITSRSKIKFIEENVDASAIGDAIEKQFTRKQKKPIDFQGPTAKKKQQRPKDVDLLFNNPLRFENDQFQSDADVIIDTTQEVQDKLSVFALVAEQIGDAVGGAFEQLGANLISSLDLAKTGFEGFIGGLATTVTKLIAIMLSSAIAQSIPGAVAAGTATGPLAVVSTPAFISTAVGGVISAFAAIPKFADGGIVYGPTVGLMGEYAGAKSNPEVIAPLNKLKQYITPNSTAPTIIGGTLKASGSELQVVLERQSKRNSRRS